MCDWCDLASSAWFNRLRQVEMRAFHLQGCFVALKPELETIICLCCLFFLQEHCTIKDLGYPLSTSALLGCTSRLVWGCSVKLNWALCVFGNPDVGSAFQISDWDHFLALQGLFFFLIFLWICSDWSSGVAGCPPSTYRWVWKLWSWQRGFTPEVENSLCGSSELWLQSEQLPSGATWQRCPWDLGVHCACWKGWFWVQARGSGVDLCSCLFCTSWKGIFLNKWYFTVFAPLQGFFWGIGAHTV